MEKPATLGQIWDTTKTYMNSNMTKKYDGVLAPETAQELGTFLMTNERAMGLGISQETKADERLQKYNIIKMMPTKHMDEFENANDVFIITDAHGHDIGIYKADVNEFILSDKIQSANDKIISQFPESSQMILKERYKIENLEDLTKKLSKDEEIALSSKEQAQDNIEEEYEKKGLAVGDGTTNQDPEEEKAIASLPNDMKAEVLEQCRERNIKIKSILVVKDPKSVAEEISDENNYIKSKGGPVIMIQARNGGLSASEDVYMFQQGKEIPDANKHRGRLLELMNQNKGTGYVVDLEDKKEDEIMEGLENAISEYEDRMKMASMIPEGEGREKAEDFARSELKEETYELIKDYVPDPDRDTEMAQTLDSIEEEVNEESSIVEDEERSRWDSADPLNGPKI